MRRRRGRYFDVMLILVAIIGFSTLFLRYYVSQSRQSSSSDTGVIKLEISGLLEESTDALAVGDTLILKTNGAVFGSISEIEVRPQMRRYSDKDGSVRYYESADRYTVRCTVLCKGSYTEGGFFLGGKTHIAPNQFLSVYGQKIECNAYVLSVKKQ